MHRKLLEEVGLLLINFLNEEDILQKKCLRQKNIQHFILYNCRQIVYMIISQVIREVCHKDIANFMSLSMLAGFCFLELSAQTEEKFKYLIRLFKKALF